MLATEGYDLVVTSAGERLDNATVDIRALGAQVMEVSTDLATYDGVEKLWQAVGGIGGKVDVACINADFGVRGLFAETELDKR